MHKRKTAFIMACHIAGVYDVNRNNTIQPDDYSLVKDWVDSISQLNLNGILFHNNFSAHTLTKYQHENVEFINIDYDNHFNPNVFRYFVYRNYLHLHSQTIKHIFITDVSDVEVVKNPFIDPFFLNNAPAIFCGDEPKPLNNEWMTAHSTHLRSKIADYGAFELAFQHETLLNCGIIGGEISIMKSLLDQLCYVHENYNKSNNTAYTGDMGAFNYIVRTQFNSHLHHGFPCNTVFKAYEKERTDCWFRHK